MLNYKYFISYLMLFLVLSLILVKGAVTEKVPLFKVGHVGHDHQLALYAAAEEGPSLEKEYGVYLSKLKDQEIYDLYDEGSRIARVQLIRVGGGSKMPAALEQGEIEAGLGGLGPVAKFIDKGAPLKVLAPLNNDGDGLVVSNRIQAADWEEFVGAVKGSARPFKIGYKSPMAVAYMIFVRALVVEGITYGQEPVGPDGIPVQVIMVNMQDLLNALPSLESGIVDGVVVNEPMVSILVHKKAGHRVTDLSKLPPSGKWEGHPCCVVAATGKTIKEKSAILRSFLKVVAAGADIISRDPGRALHAEAVWTRTDPEVGKQSIANVKYVIYPDKEWLHGVDTWLEMMIGSNHFKKKLKGKSPEEIRKTILDLEPINSAVTEIHQGSEK